NLLVKVIDVAGGTFLLTGTSLGDTAHELESAREWPTGSQGDLDQASVDRSLTLAIQSLTKSILETLTNAPWKGFVKSISGSTAILSAGRDVGIKPGHRFVVLGVGEKITNTAGRTYIIPGPVKATLEITRVLAETSEARITSGHILAGEAVYFAS
ncbi:MAG: hypothetical protein JRI54_01735, partial [Deltaproteobacteria bacterium]|nr:hypothetical protein [Deltaproteobacteria bacterium]